MIRPPAPALTAEEAAILARFDAAPVPPEVQVETVARAILATWEKFPLPMPADEAARRLAAAAIAADPSPAEQAVKRVEALAEEWESGGQLDRYCAAEIRAALASPAPDPQGDPCGCVEGKVVCGFHGEGW